MSEATEELELNRHAITILRGSKIGRKLEFPMIGPDGQPGIFEFYQDTLGMMPMQDFFTNVKTQIQSFVDGEYGFKLGELFRGETEMPSAQEVIGSLATANSGGNGSDGEATGEDLDNVVDQYRPFINAFFKLVDIVPGLEMDIYILSLGVEAQQEAWFRSAVSRPPSQGGFTIDEGFDILRMFIKQNARDIRRFFTEMATDLATTFREEMDAIAPAAKKPKAKSMAKPGRSTGGRQPNTSAQDTPASA